MLRSRRMIESSHIHDGHKGLSEAFAEIALVAGRSILDVRGEGFTARQKADFSPVTEADERAELIILELLARLLPDIPVIAEECVSRGEVAAIAGRFILVDPLDGTREFLAGHNDFTVNIALIDAGAPIAGVVFAPALERLWVAGREAFAVRAQAGSALPDRRQWREIKARPAPDQGLVALISRSHMDARTLDELAMLPVAEKRPMGSSVKFCLIAEGEADIYPRFGPTMEWDTAAGDAVLRAAGGAVLGEDERPMRYGREGRDFRNGGFIAWGDLEAHRRLILMK
jgi:3'(2'), 5'-bisphosphate nucleotidase